MVIKKPIQGSIAGWTGSGSGSYTGPNNPGSVTMGGPITETGNFSPETNAETSISSSSVTLVRRIALPRPRTTVDTEEKAKSRE